MFFNYIFYVFKNGLITKNPTKDLGRWCIKDIDKFSRYSKYHNYDNCFTPLEFVSYNKR